MESSDRVWTKVVLNVPLPGDSIPRCIWSGVLGPMPSPPNPPPPQRLICCIEAGPKLSMSASDVRMMISGDPVTLWDLLVSVPHNPRPFTPIKWACDTLPIPPPVLLSEEVLDRCFWGSFRRLLSLSPAWPSDDAIRSFLGFETIVYSWSGLKPPHAREPLDQDNREVDRDDSIYDNVNAESNDENSEDTSEESDNDSEDEMKCVEDS